MLERAAGRKLGGPVRASPTLRRRQSAPGQRQRDIVACRRAELDDAPDRRLDEGYVCPGELIVRDALELGERRRRLVAGGDGLVRETIERFVALVGAPGLPQRERLVTKGR